MTLGLLDPRLPPMEPWFAGARAKHASLMSTANAMLVFATVAATPGAAPADAAAPQLSYPSLVREHGAATVWSALDDHYEPKYVFFKDEACA